MKKNTLNTIIFLLTIIIARYVLRSIGIENMSAITFGIIIVGAYTIFLISTLKNINKGIGKTYNVILCILMGVLCFSTFLGFTVMKQYPEVFSAYGLYFIGLFFLSFVLLAFFCIFAKIKYDRRNR